MKPTYRAAIVAALLTCAPVAAVAQPSAAQAPPPAPSVTPPTLHIPEGTELSIRFEDEVSSASATVGDEFTISSVDPVTLPDGKVLPAGFKGVGEVTAAHKRGMMGKGGELNVRLDYLKVGNTRVRLRGSKGGSGQDSTGATVALTVLFGPLGLLKHGHDITINKGQKIVAYVDQDVDVPLPVSAVPAAQ